MRGLDVLWVGDACEADGQAPASVRRGFATSGLPCMQVALQVGTAGGSAWAVQQKWIMSSSTFKGNAYK